MGIEKRLIKERFNYELPLELSCIGRFSGTFVSRLTQPPQPRRASRLST